MKPLQKANASRRRFRAVLRVALLLLACVAFTTTTPDPATAGVGSKRLKVYWVGRHRSVTLEYKSATSELAKAKAAQKKARQRNRLQGERRVKLNTALEEATTRHATAKKALDAFPDAARRAGAPPGWFR